MRSPVMLGLVLVASLALTACGGGGTASPAASGTTGAEPPAAAGSVSIVDFGFEPTGLSVPVGTTVTWTNTGAATHTVKWSDGAPESDGLANGATYERTFDAAGSYPYVCGIHGSMAGTVTVTE
jgi:plastocyanin